MKKGILIASALACGLVMPAANAEECGEAPVLILDYPDGSTATTEEMRVAREALLSYSQNIDAFLTCMDGRASKLFPYMTKDQQARWEEDLNALHNERRDHQIAFNEVIRAFRRAQNGQ